MEFAVTEIPPPEEAKIVGQAYSLGPDGSTFDRLITINWKYQPSEIPSGVAEADLVVAYYDKDTGQWLELVSIVDAEANTITAFVNHFTIFAVIAHSPPPPPPPLPAAFTASLLSVSPTEVNAGESVNISAVLTNIGEEEGSYPVTLRINGVTAETKEVALDGGANETVVFTTSQPVADDYTVGVDSLSGSFTVKEVPPPPAIVSGRTLSLIITAVFLAVFLPIRLRKKKTA